MNKSILFQFDVDKKNNKIFVKRSFAAPLDLVWAAWTDPAILDLWWAPKPYKTETKSMNFTVGGVWLYCMVSPKDERHWCFFKYTDIQHEKSYAGWDAFCDENGEANDTKPIVDWFNSFSAQGDETTVTLEITFKSLTDLEAIIDMGFKEGFTMGMENLDQYIGSQFYLRKQKKPDTAPRVSTYVNFPGNTEEAFLFYKSVFKTEFVLGMQKFGDLPPDPNQPAMSESLKNMVIHVELPLLGGHILMGTDAPLEMGFAVERGNNMHINLEPSSKEEADRIFLSLSQGGEIEMPMQDMFWGAYFGSFRDKYGINWMVNFQPTKG
ncbi:MAG: SRPBCC domain-containing protein [Saprospiraceae bacterium]